MKYFVIYKSKGSPRKFGREFGAPHLAHLLEVTLKSLQDNYEIEKIKVVG